MRADTELRMAGLSAKRPFQLAIVTATSGHVVPDPMASGLAVLALDAPWLCPRLAAPLACA